jgi:hypothetical protein
VAKLTRLTHKISIQLHLVAENFTICSSCSKRPVQKLLDGKVAIQLSLPGKMGAGMNVVEVVKEIIQLFWSMRSDHECIINVMEPASGHVSHPTGCMYQYTHTHTHTHTQKK